MSKKLRGTAINNVSYTGIVKLSQYMKGKKFHVAEIHNEGGKPLFEFLVDCLKGDFEIAKPSRPAKILLLNVYEDDEGKHVVTAASNTSFIYLLTNPEKVYSDREGIIKYSFVIPQEYFAAGDANGAIRFNAIGLYADSATAAEDYSAYCTVDTSNWNISMSSVLVLDWELHIANQN